MITLHSKHVFQLSKAHETVKPKWQTYYKLVCEKSIRKISVTGKENVFVEAEYVNKQSTMKLLAKNKKNYPFPKKGREINIPQWRTWQKKEELSLP